MIAKQQFLNYDDAWSFLRTDLSEDELKGCWDVLVAY